MKLIFDVTHVQEPLEVMQVYMARLKSFPFDDEIWVTQLQKDTIFKDFDKFYRGIPIKVIDEAN